MTTDSFHSSIARSTTSTGLTVDWRRLLNHRLWLTDSLVVLAAVFGAQLFRFSSLTTEETVVLRGFEFDDLSYTVLSVVLVAGWMWALTLTDSRSERFVGQGVREYRQVSLASFGLFGAVAILAYLLQVDVARGYLLISLPTGLLLLLLTRRAWRQWLVARRARGDFLATMLLVGSAETVAQIAVELARQPAAGYRVVGACVAGGTTGVVPGTTVPVYGSIDDLATVLERTGADTVAVSGCAELPPDRVKRIAWSLESTGHHLVLAPSLIDVAGPRIHTRDVAGLPLIHVEIPQLTTAQRMVKRAFDLAIAGIGLVLISPLLVVLAVVVRASSRGPVLFRQTRIGLGGAPFTMWKFRSMVVDAEALRGDLVVAGEQDAGNAVQLKWRDDPRVTRAGRWMRRYSLDELPQLVNVLTGSMSLVGPRPHLVEEVAAYEEHVRRRFLMKPGITGLWQVSGRSALSWEESVRLDLSYVENWSLFADLIIMFRTVRAVLRPGETAF